MTRLQKCCTGPAPLGDEPLNPMHRDADSTVGSAMLKITPRTRDLRQPRNSQLQYQEGARVGDTHISETASRKHIRSQARHPEGTTFLEGKFLVAVWQLRPTTLEASLRSACAICDGEWWHRRQLMISQFKMWSLTRRPCVSLSELVVFFWSSVSTSLASTLSLFCICAWWNSSTGVSVAWPVPARVSLYSVWSSHTRRVVSFGIREGRELGPC